MINFLGGNLAERKRNSMGLTLIFIFIVGISSSVAGPNCRNISGVWQNELGSYMVIHVDKLNFISGQYCTAVESKPGAAAIVSNVTGMVFPRKEGTLLAFSVIFNHGASETSWVGQCSVCDGKKEVLYTTYSYKKYVVDPKAKWGSIIVNQNTFWRSEAEVPDVCPKPDSQTFLPLSSQPIASSLYSGGLDIVGKWKSSAGGEIEILRTDLTSTSGELISDGNKANRIYIAWDHSTVNIPGSEEEEEFSGFAFGGVFDRKIRSWTGHQSGSSVPRVMETVWIDHEYSAHCPHLNIVRHGMENFTRISPNDGYTSTAPSETVYEKIINFFASMF